MSITEAIAAEDPFTREPHAFERSLLGHVVEFGTCLKAVNGCGREQIVDELALGVSPDPAASVLGEYADPNLEVPRLADRPPAHHAGTASFLESNRKCRRGRAHQTVLGPAPLELMSLLHAEAEPLELSGHLGVGMYPHQLGQLGLLHRPQPDEFSHGISLHDRTEPAPRHSPELATQREQIGA